MKHVRLEDLKGNELLAMPVLSAKDTILIQSDIVLTEDYISRIRELNVNAVYIYDNDKDGNPIETKEVEEIEAEKSAPHFYKVDETAANSREVVKGILEKHIYKHNKELKKISEEAEKIIDSVLSEPEVVNNITEIRNISTDMYTHCINVCSLATIMALRLRMSDKQVYNVSMGAILHDIVLRYVKTDYINNNETTMSEKDASDYMKHTVFGYSSIQDEDWLSDVAKEIILFHHEKIDGSGYPFHLTEEKIKPEIRLVTICDDFDSMISGIGSPKFKIYEAIEYIKVKAGVIYDSTIAAKFLDSMAAYPVGATVILSDGEKGVVVRQNREMPDRPVLKMTYKADGSPYETEVEKNLMTARTIFVIDTE